MDTRLRNSIAYISLLTIVSACLYGCGTENSNEDETRPLRGTPVLVERRHSSMQVLAPPPSSADELQVIRNDNSEMIEMSSAIASSTAQEDDTHESGEEEPPDTLPPNPGPDDLSEIIITGLRVNEPPSWRASVKPRDCDKCEASKQVQERMDYTLSIRLANDEAMVEGGQVSDSMTELYEQIPEDRSITLKLVPLFVDGLEPFGNDDAEPLELVIRKLDAPGIWGQSDLQFVVRPNAKKCASLIVSVWDVTLTIAYDAFLVTLPVGKPGTTSQCPDPRRQETLLSDVSLVSVSDVFQPPVAPVAPEVNDRISLYAFELPIKRNSYVFAVIAPAEGQTTISGWKLKTPLSESFGQQAGDFNLAAQRDRERMNGADDTEWIYKETARFIKKKLFTAESTSGGANPLEVFEKMRMVINRDGANANVMAQIFVPITGSDESGLMFLPLRTLGAANSDYFRDFRFTSPLPGAGEENAETPACISTWRLVLNTSLADSTGDSANAQSTTQAAIERLAALEPQGWRPPAMTSNQSIRDFFESQHDAEDQNGSTGIIIATHYGRRNLALENGEVIGVEDMTAYRAPQSIAVLAACETASPSEANGIIRSLREQNVDAFLASPLQVPTDYAIRLVESLVKQIDLAYAAGDQPTLAELYAAAMENVEFHSESQRVEARNLGREFVIVGDASRRLCKLPSMEGDGNGQIQNP